MFNLSKTEQKLTEYAVETMIYFEKHKLIEIAKKILVECSLYRPVDAQLWIGKNIKRIADEIYLDCLNEGNNGVIKNLYMTPCFLYRFVMFGRPGSGRKTQACNLISAFNLVLIDAESLIYKHLRGDDDNPYDALDRELQRAFYYDNCAAKSKAILNIIAKRVLQEDCLRRGWVLINFAHTLQDFRDIFENFKIPPNRLVYLMSCENTCIRRLTNMPHFDKPSNNAKHFEQEMYFFKRHETEIYEYLSKRHETVFVNAEQRSEDVKTFLVSCITKSPNIMGVKQNIQDYI